MVFLMRSPPVLHALSGLSLVSLRFLASNFLWLNDRAANTADDAV